MTLIRLLCTIFIIKSDQDLIKQGKKLISLLESATQVATTIDDEKFSNDEYAKMEQLLTDNGSLYLYGDSSFSYRETRLQQLFMSLVIARSVSDVLDTYVNSRKENTFVLTNSFGRFYWTSRISEFKKLTPSIKPALAKITFGEYQPAQHFIPLYSTVYDLAVSHVSTLSKEEKQEQSAIEIDLLFSLFGSYSYPLGNNSRDSKGKANQRFRSKIFPFGGSIPIGFTYLADDYTKSYKMKVEPMWHFSKYSAFIGIPVTYGKYEHKKLNLNSNQWGIGAEAGLGFGMIHFVGGIVLDSLYAEQGGLDKMLMMKAGLRVIFPGSRLPWMPKVSN